ncbi:MbtH family NRPS accessory protein [Nocardiopsis sp. JB363]|uniref:MbtH family protein n=1 Tax=Nocardiopsis sp. JB363 TaxID=1434837 RepID=UPI00097B68C5|nr:MbtH family NRPS accessory protein [Nocardiopsis sp. JB363]SIO91386.1 MbtH-like protein [Nocardiopsis sp. JB363]
MTTAREAASVEGVPTHSVVVNHEEQYSVWRTDRPRPVGWDDAGFQGDYEECLDHIERVWTDMRPRSARPEER